MRMNYERFQTLIAAAIECLDAYERLGNAMADLAHSTDLAADIQRNLTNTDLKPSMNAMLTLKFEQKECKKNANKYHRNRDAVRRHRERKKHGLTTNYAADKTRGKYKDEIAQYAAEEATQREGPADDGRGEVWTVEKSEGQTKVSTAHAPPSAGAKDAKGELEF